jgi:phosphoenolpyruvate phosphomutase
MIHSRKRDGKEILDFAAQFRRECPQVPLVCVPTSYSHLRFSQLQDAGFNVVVYANHMLRSSYLAMQQVAAGILRDGRSQEVEPLCLGVNEILSLIPEQPSLSEADSAEGTLDTGALGLTSKLASERSYL